MTRHDRTVMMLTSAGIAQLTVGAVLMWYADGDPWSTVGLIIGLIGSGFLGTAGSIALFPDYPDEALAPNEVSQTPELSSDFDPPIASLSPKRGKA